MAPDRAEAPEISMREKLLDPDFEWSFFILQIK